MGMTAHSLGNGRWRGKRDNSAPLQNTRNELKTLFKGPVRRFRMFLSCGDDVFMGVPQTRFSVVHCVFCGKAQKGIISPPSKTQGGHAARTRRTEGHHYEGEAARERGAGL